MGEERTRNATTCKTCHRAVYVEHVDEHGLCVFCQPKTEVAEEPTLPDMSPSGEKKDKE